MLYHSTFLSMVNPFFFFQAWVHLFTTPRKTNMLPRLFRPSPSPLFLAALRNQRISISRALSTRRQTTSLCLPSHTFPLHRPYSSPTKGKVENTNFGVDTLGIIFGNNVYRSGTSPRTVLVCVFCDTILVSFLSLMDCARI